MDIDFRGALQQSLHFFVVVVTASAATPSPDFHEEQRVLGKMQYGTKGTGNYKRKTNEWEKKERKLYSVFSLFNSNQVIILRRELSNLSFQGVKH